jgi:hypothetical protein
MDSNQLDDLKQFITASISQAEERLLTEIKEVSKEMAEGFAGVGEAIEGMHKQSDDQNKIVDARFTKLEQQAV